MDKKILSQRTIKNYASQYLRYLRLEHGLVIQAAYLFGSHAKKTARQWSDVDVCVISQKFKNTDGLSYLWKRRRGIDIDRGIEPYGLAPNDFVAENPIASEVKKYGIKIK